jgi:Arc/MetJ-type ribon-helix-helix transcriptional regulator
VSSLGPKRKDSSKKAVSIRMSRNDIRHIKQLAERLGARESDVIRFAIKTMLEQLAPLQDPKARGRALVPVFVESGADLVRHFELDAGKLSGIINDGVEDERRVEPDDIQLLAMSGIHRSHLHMRAAGLEPPEKPLRRYLYEKYIYGGCAVPTNVSGSAV